jgi:glucokinase
MTSDTPKSETSAPQTESDLVNESATSVDRPNEELLELSSEEREALEASSPLILIGDIGGTNARLALVQGATILHHATYLTSECADFNSLIQRFVSSVEPDDLKPQSACFGVAGPVLMGEVKLTNIGWTLRQHEIEATLGCPVRLVNDFYAQAVVVPYLIRPSVVHLCGPDLLSPTPRPIGVLGAGTGLGEALLFPISAGDECVYHAIPTEGGHGRFAPRNEAEIGLSRWLQGRYGEHVSVERVVSGQGLIDLFYYFLGGRPLPEQFTEPVTPSMISEAALSQVDEVSVRALDHFVGVYADEAANLALKSNAGSIYLSGGISPKILPALHDAFQSAFLNKGRYRNWLSQVSVWVVTAPEPGLMGAQIIAEEIIEERP